jgi:hypothetical protein
MDDARTDKKETLKTDVNDTQEELEAEKDGEADYLFFGAGAETDDKLLNSLIQANKEIDGLEPA